MFLYFPTLHSATWLVPAFGSCLTHDSVSFRSTEIKRQLWCHFVDDCVAQNKILLTQQALYYCVCSRLCVWYVWLLIMCVCSVLFCVGFFCVFLDWYVCLRCLFGEINNIVVRWQVFAGSSSVSVDVDWGGADGGRSRRSLLPSDATVRHITYQVIRYDTVIYSRSLKHWLIARLI